MRLYFSIMLMTLFASSLAQAQVSKDCFLLRLNENSDVAYACPHIDFNSVPATARTDLYGIHQNFIERVPMTFGKEWVFGNGRVSAGRVLPVEGKGIRYHVSFNLFERSSITQLTIRSLESGQVQVSYDPNAPTRRRPNSGGCPHFGVPCK